MRNGAIIAVAFVLFAACSPEQQTALPSPVATVTVETPSPTPVSSAFDIGRAMTHDRALSVEIGKRIAGTPGASLAADYIAQKMQAVGLSVERQEFPLPQGGVSWNVIGKPVGFDENKPYLLVGGHYDTRRGPGANDNGSGIAVVLELARSIGIKPASLPVAFVAFGAEEVQPVPGTGHHHIGSRFYVPHMSAAAKKNLVDYVNVDMVGVGNGLYCMRMNVGPREGTDRCVAVGANLKILAVERVTPDWSDNGTFLKAGMNATALWSGEQPCCNHKLTDTIEKVQPELVEKAGRLALAIVRSYSR